MATPAQGHIFPSESISNALVACLIKQYKDESRRPLGRTILQKLCYFAKASGVPLPFRFEIYHYGPFSQEIFDRTEDLLSDGVIEDWSGDPGQSNYVPGSTFDAYLNVQRASQQRQCSFICSRDKERKVQSRYRREGLRYIERS